MTTSMVQQFLRRLLWRQTVVSFARQWRFLLLITLGIYALALLISRLFGVFPGWFTLITLACVPTAALLFSLVSYHRPDSAEVARLADVEMKTHDLFLTASQIDHSLGAYQSLVLKEAEERAAKVPAQKVIPFHWERDTLRIGAIVAALVLGTYLLPHWDPFGLQVEQRKLAEQRQLVNELNKATQARAALLEQKRTGEQADVVKQAIAELQKTLLDAKPNDKAGTLAKLNEQQKALGQLWKQTTEEKLKNGLNLPPTTQSFGLADPTKAEQLRKDLEKGDISSAEKEIEELKKKAEELAAAKDPVAREKLQQELMDRMQSLKDTLGRQMNSQAVDSALQRALEQLAMANTPSLSSESLKGMCNSLNLSQKELQDLAKAMAGMKNLEQALKALQAAKALHNLQPLDGKEFAKLGDLAAYCAYCQGKCQSLVPGNGLGAGYGIGQRPHGNENSKTDFHPDKSSSQLQPGRMLMEWKTREVSEAGPAREEYQRAMQNVRQQASEAVVQEQIPPGYQAGIKKYFDTLQNDSSAKSQP